MARRLQQVAPSSPPQPWRAGTAGEADLGVAELTGAASPPLIASSSSHASDSSFQRPTEQPAASAATVSTASTHKPGSVSFENSIAPSPLTSPPSITNTTRTATGANSAAQRTKSTRSPASTVAVATAPAVVDVVLPLPAAKLVPKGLKAVPAPIKRILPRPKRRSKFPDLPVPPPSPKHVYDRAPSAPSPSGRALADAETAGLPVCALTGPADDSHAPAIPAVMPWPCTVPGVLRSNSPLARSRPRGNLFGALASTGDGTIGHASTQPPTPHDAEHLHLGEPPSFASWYSGFQAQVAADSVQVQVEAQFAGTGTSTVTSTVTRHHLPSSASPYDSSSRTDAAELKVQLPTVAGGSHGYSGIRLTKSTQNLRYDPSGQVLQPPSYAPTQRTSAFKGTTYHAGGAATVNSTQMVSATPGARVFRPPNSRLAQTAMHEDNWKLPTVAVGRFSGRGSTSMSAETFSRLAAAPTGSTGSVSTPQPGAGASPAKQLPVSSATGGHSAASPSGPESLARVHARSSAADAEFKATMLHNGFVSSLSSAVCPVGGCVYVDTFMRMKGVDAVVFKYSLRSKILSCLGQATTAEFPEISVEDVDIVELSNMGEAPSNSMRKVFEVSQMDMLDNAYEGQVKRFREAQNKQVSRLKGAVQVWASVKVDKRAEAVQARLAAKRIAHNLAGRFRARNRPPPKEVSEWDLEVTEEGKAALALAKLDAFLAEALPTAAFPVVASGGLARIASRGSLGKEAAASPTAEAGDGDSSDTDSDTEVANIIRHDIDPDTLSGHLYLTSNIHNIPYDYPAHYFEAGLRLKCEFERAPEITYKRQLETTHMAGSKAYYSKAVLKSATTQMLVRVCCPKRLITQLQRFQYGLCDSGYINIERLDAAIPRAMKPSAIAAQHEQYEVEMRRLHKRGSKDLDPIEVAQQLQRLQVAQAQLQMQAASFSKADMERTPLPKATSAALINLRFSCEFGTRLSVTDLQDASENIRSYAFEGKLASEQISKTQDTMKAKYARCLTDLKRFRGKCLAHVIQVSLADAEKAKLAEE